MNKIIFHTKSHLINLIERLGYTQHDFINNEVRKFIDKYDSVLNHLTRLRYPANRSKMIYIKDDDNPLFVSGLKTYCKAIGVKVETFIRAVLLIAVLEEYKNLI